MQERVEEPGDKFKEVTGVLPQNPLAPQNGSVPEDQIDHETCAALLRTSPSVNYSLTEFCLHRTDSVAEQFLD